MKFLRQCPKSAMCGQTVIGLRTAATTSGTGATGYVLRITEQHGGLRVGFMKGPAGVITKVDGVPTEYTDRLLRRTLITDLQAMRTDITRTRITTIMEKATDITAMMISLPV